MDGVESAVASSGTGDSVCGSNLLSVVELVGTGGAGIGVTVVPGS